MSTPPAGPLAGIRVLEVGHVLAGPFGGMLLADLGADVIKIEPIDGDLSRQVGSQVIDGHNVYFASLNRNKRSIHIDLATPEGQEQLGALAATAHALLVNMRPSTIRKLGLDYESLRRFNEKIVCVAVTGYGLDGPAADWPAFDYVIQAGTGVAAMTGEPDGPPALAGYSAVDNSTGAMAALGLVAKVLEGKGGQVDVSLFDALAEWMGYPAYYTGYGGAPLPRTGAAHAAIAPYGPYTAGDGKVVYLGLQNEREWARFCAEVLGQPALASDRRFSANAERVAHRQELDALINAAFATHSAEDVLARLDAAQIANARMNTVQEFLEHPQLAARDRWRTVQSPAGPIRALLPPFGMSDTEPRMGPIPSVGEHTDAILGELGYDAAAIARFRSSGAI